MAPLIIADRPDPLIEMFCDGVRSRGRRIEWLDFAEAANLFRVSRQGLTCTVYPDLPTILRLPHSDRAWDDADQQFHRAERRSLVWAAAALMKSVVINRPNVHGFAACGSSSAHVIRHRLGLSVGALEVCASECPDPMGEAAHWWTESAREGFARPWHDSAITGPFRAGAVHADDEQSLVIVAGAEVLRAPTHQLRQASAEACRKLGLGFAAVSWRRRHGEESLLRVDPHPRLDHVAGVEEAVTDALWAVLNT